MKCPKCGGEIKAWPWSDGGYKGVRCEACDQRWWSNDIAEAFDDAERAAVRAVIDASEFPADAQTEEEHRQDSAQKKGRRRLAIAEESVRCQARYRSSEERCRFRGYSTRDGRRVCAHHRFSRFIQYVAESNVPNKGTPGESK